MVVCLFANILDKPTNRIHSGLSKGDTCVALIVLDYVALVVNLRLAEDIEPIGIVARPIDGSGALDEERSVHRTERCAERQVVKQEAEYLEPRRGVEKRSAIVQLCAEVLAEAFEIRMQFVSARVEVVPRQIGAGHTGEPLSWKARPSMAPRTVRTSVCWVV